MALLTPALAKSHLGRPDLADDDPELVQKMAAAEAAALAFVQAHDRGKANVTAWLADPASAPADVVHALLVQLDEMWRFHGGDLDNEMPARDEKSDLHPAVTALLLRYRGLVSA